MRQNQLPLLISGPCSAETREQVLATAEALSYFRSGIWKPRTQPGAFEGIGEIGLEWLQEVRQTYGFKICTEVATAEHVELAKKYKLDMVWIGARSTVNPFTVQELAEALQGSGIPVMVKNPVNPDLKLWIGAIERLQRHDVEVIGAIHRGFSVYEKTNYRNNPDWQIAIDLKQELPKLKLIMDPSHIGGRADLIQPLAQQALDLNYDGLMIESHVDPTVAWTDAKQQITPQRLKEIYSALEPRNPAELQANVLSKFREQLSFIDESLIRLLQQRMSISKEIGIHKRQHNQHILQAQRWEETFKANVEKAVQSGLSEEFAKQMIKMLHEESLRIQMAVNSLPDHEDQGQ